MSATSSDSRVRSGPDGVTFGLRVNWRRFALLVLINAFVGGMVRIERTVVPLINALGLGGVCRSVTQ